MAYYLSVRPVNKERNNQVWARIANGSFLENRTETITDLEGYINNLKESVSQHDAEFIKHYVGLIEGSISDYYQDIFYFNPRHPFHPYFSELFKSILGIDVEKDYHIDTYRGMV